MDVQGDQTPAKTLFVTHIYIYVCLCTCTYILYVFAWCIKLSYTNRVNAN